MRKTAILVSALALVVTAGLGMGWYVRAQQVPASQVAIGGKVENVELASVAGQPVWLYDHAGAQGTLVIFVATRCPVSNDYNERMAALPGDYAAKGVAVVGINANRQESAEEVASHAKQHGFSFPVLKDPGNLQADRFGAQVTPEAFVFDAAWTLRYHGRIDDSRNPANINTRDLRAAMDAILAGKTLAVTETKAFGCTIKRVSKTS